MEDCEKNASETTAYVMFGLWTVLAMTVNTELSVSRCYNINCLNYTQKFKRNVT